MDHKTRLGPAAVFFTLIVIVAVMLVILTTATAIADSAMAERFASVTRTRYDLEAMGEDFLCEAAEAGARLEKIEGVEKAEDGGYLYTAEQSGYRIEIKISEPDADGSYKIISRKIVRDWKTEDPMNSIWHGPGSNQ